jgi:competence protein ComEA
VRCTSLGRVAGPIDDPLGRRGGQVRETGVLGRILGSARASSSEMGLVALLGLAILGASILVWVRSSDPPAPPVQRVVAPSPTPAPAKRLIVHVAGQVSSPGVYEVPEGSRVKDAIAAAGGPMEPADVNALNLAAPLADGQKIVVTKPGDTPPVAVALADGEAAAGIKVNLNSATQAQLEELPSVGPVIAERILAYRQTKGAFKSTRQLLDVSGVGPKKYEALKDLVTV